MPTIFRIDGLRIVIYPNDHRPAHVHVIGPTGEAVFILNCPDGPPDVRESYGFKPMEVSRIVDALTDALAVLCNEWNRIHGKH